MNLRQIVRNQKLQNFNYNLSDFITEADDEEVEKKDAFAGKTDAKEPKNKYWYVKDGEYKARVNHPGEGWELADKKKAEKAEKDTDDEQDIEVDIDDEARDFINQEMKAQNLKPSREDENVFVDKDGDEIFQIDADGEVIPGGDIDKFKSAEGEPYADYIQDINDRLYGDEGEEKDTEQSDNYIPEVTKADVKAAQNNIENAGEPNIKDKSLGGVDEAVFKATIPPATTDEQFKENMKNSGSKSIDPPVSFSKSQQKRFFSKVPQVYAPVIERMLSQTVGKASITDFMKGVGAGQAASQAGEILTMVAITMDNDASEEFFNMLEDRVNDPNYPTKDTWIDKSWLKSAQQVREGTIARYNGAYGEGNWEIDKGCWDSATEVEGMGLKDYTKNKGFSTDTYMRLNVDGKPVLDEISLKKDLNVNLLNKTTNALVDFSILGSDEAGLYTQLNELWDEIPENKRNKKDIKYDVGGTEMTAREIQEKIKDMKSQAFDKLAKDNPDLADQIQKASGERAKREQRRLLDDAIGQGSLATMRKAAENFEDNKDKDPLKSLIDGLRGNKRRDVIEGYAREAVEVLTATDEDGNYKFDGITFESNDDGDLVVKKNGEELNTAQKKDIFGYSDSGKIQKIAWYATVLGAGTGSKELKGKMNAIENNIKEHTNAVITSINEIPQMRQGMLNAIREEFPLKALFEGEEAMALAQYNCDPKVLKEIFEGAESYEDIQDKLEISEDDEGELSLVYRAEAGGSESIPVAKLDARSDGKGYGNTFKFELKVHKAFKDALINGNRDAYPDSGVYEHSINLGNILAEDKQNTLAFHWKKAEDDYPIHYFLRDLNEGSLK